MKEHPILFSGPMIRAILAGRKTVTRRLVKVTMPAGSELELRDPDPRGTVATVLRPDGTLGGGVVCPFGAVGDRLWVRETWRPWVRAWSSHVQFRADNVRGAVLDEETSDAVMKRCNKRGGHWDDGRGANPADTPWTPSIFMPKGAARIWLRVESVGVERLQDITPKDIIAEGAVERAHDDQFGHNPVSTFDGKVYMDLQSLWARGWDAINGKRAPWASNPWVWRVGFSVVEP